MVNNMYRYIYWDMHNTDLVSRQCTALARYQHSNQALLFDQNWCSKNRRYFPSSDLHRSIVYRSIYKLGEIKDWFVYNVVVKRKLVGECNRSKVYSQNVKPLKEKDRRRTVSKQGLDMCQILNKGTWRTKRVRKYSTEHFQSCNSGFLN